MRIYIDMVSSEPPQHRGKDRTAPPWRPHAVRIAAAVEEESGNAIGGVLIATLTPAGSWRCDLEWIGRYMGNSDGLVGTTPASIVAASPWLFDPDAIFVGHNAPFHRMVLDGLIQDAGGPPGERDWFDTMREAEPVCCLPARGRSGTKAPSLAEAYGFFTGSGMAPAASLPAREAALGQLNAVRAVYWGIRRWGMPEPIPMPGAP